MTILGTYFGKKIVVSSAFVNGILVITAFVNRIQGNKTRPKEIMKYYKYNKSKKDGEKVSDNIIWYEALSCYIEAQATTAHR